MYSGADVSTRPRVVGHFGLSHTNSGFSDEHPADLLSEFHSTVLFRCMIVCRRPSTVKGRAIVLEAEFGRVIWRLRSVVWTMLWSTSFLAVMAIILGSVVVSQCTRFSILLYRVICTADFTSRGLRRQLRQSVLPEGEGLNNRHIVSINRSSLGTSEEDVFDLMRHQTCLVAHTFNDVAVGAHQWAISK
jgi:hypothetical protein